MARGAFLGPDGPLHAREFQGDVPLRDVERFDDVSETDQTPPGVSSSVEVYRVLWST
jgi:hypothetical protein